MRCHYCEDEADIAVEREGLKVGLCKDHFRERLEELQNDGWLEDVHGQLDTDRFD